MNTEEQVEQQKPGFTHFILETIVTVFLILIFLFFLIKFLFF